MPQSNSDVWSISPLDGRYRSSLLPLRDLVSEAGLIKYRLQVEAAWLLFLNQNLPTSVGTAMDLSEQQREVLQQYAKDSRSIENELIDRIKLIEKTTNHDVKAVEYGLREVLNTKGSQKINAWIHFACTSEDINNLSYALMMKEVKSHVLNPIMRDLLLKLKEFIDAYAAVPMLSRTHGQAASPTTLGKEFAVFGHRLLKALKIFEQVIPEGKINGAVGNFNAHYVVFPEVNWEDLSKRFITDLGLMPNLVTTQIENHDSLVRYLDSLTHFNQILIGLSQDLWSYISIGYFKLKNLASEVGSSTMPHKVNPIDFENAEGNLGIARGICRFMSDKLPISRWQRDLSDSTVLRNFGSAIGYSYLGYISMLKGLNKLSPDFVRMSNDLDPAYEVLTEALQTVLRRYGVIDAYEQIKDLSRGQKLSAAQYEDFIASCASLPEFERDRLKKMVPSEYLGMAEHLARSVSSDLSRYL